MKEINELELAVRRTHNIDVRLGDNQLLALEIAVGVGDLVTAVQIAVGHVRGRVRHARATRLDAVLTIEAGVFQLAAATSLLVLARGCTMMVRGVSFAGAASAGARELRQTHDREDKQRLHDA